MQHVSAAGKMQQECVISAIHAHLLDDLVVVATTETPVSGDGHQQDGLDWPDVKEG